MRWIAIGTLLVVVFLGYRLFEGDGGVVQAGELPPDTARTRYFPAGATATDLRALVEEGLNTKGKGPNLTRFIVIRDGSRHSDAWGIDGFHFVIGAGKELPLGAIAAQRNWSLGGRIDGRNEELDTMGIAVAVEPGADRPYAPEIAAAVRAICEALVGQVAIHPHCIVGMGEVPYAAPHPAAGDELELARAARKDLPRPPVDRVLEIRTADKKIDVKIEVRDTDQAIATGMMMRRSFDGADRGMLFVYPHATYRHFYMKNCFFPIDLAYIYEGKIDEIFPSIAPQAGASPNRREFDRYQSRSPVRHVLEMPGGWFAENGITVGARVNGLP